MPVGLVICIGVYFIFTLFLIFSSFVDPFCFALDVRAHPRKSIIIIIFWPLALVYFIVKNILRGLVVVSRAVFLNRIGPRDPQEELPIQTDSPERAVTGSVPAGFVAVHTNHANRYIPMYAADIETVVRSAQEDSEAEESPASDIERMNELAEQIAEERSRLEAEEYKAPEKKKRSHTEKILKRIV